MVRTSIFLVIILLINLFPINLLTVYAGCPLCEKGVSTRRISMISTTIEYVKLRSDYYVLRDYYIRLKTFGYNPPASAGDLLLAIGDILDDIRVLIDDGEVGDASYRIKVARKLINDLNTSLNEFMSHSYPNRWIYQFYGNSFNSILNMVSFMLIIAPYTSFGTMYMDELMEIKYKVSSLINDLNSTNLAVLEGALRDMDTLVRKYRLLFNLDKIDPFKPYITYEYVYGFKANLLHLLDVVGDVINHSKIGWVVEAYRESLPRMLSYIKIGDVFLFVQGDYRAAYYFYALVDGYLRYFIDNRFILYGNTSVYSIELDVGRPIIYLVDDGGSVSVAVILRELLFFLDVDGDGYINDDEIVASLDLSTAGWDIASVDGGRAKYLFSNYFLNISVSMDLQPNIYVWNPITGVGEPIIIGNYSIPITFSLHTNYRGLDDVRPGLVIEVVVARQGASIRWDHFLSVDSLNIDAGGGTLMSIFFPQYNPGFWRNSIYIFNFTAPPDTYDILLIPMVDGVGGYSVTMWIRPGVSRDWLSTLFDYISTHYILIIFFVAVAAAFILLYLVRFWYIWDVT